MSEIRVTSVVGENGGDRVGLTTGLTVGPLTGTTGIGATITHHGHAQFAGVCTATSFVGNGAGLTGLSNIGKILKFATFTHDGYATGNYTGGVPSSTSMGYQLFSTSYTPAAANSTCIVISSSIVVSEDSNFTNHFHLSLFNGSTFVSAVGGSGRYVGFRNYLNSATLNYVGSFASGSTSARNISMRVGCNDTGTLYINGNPESAGTYSGSSNRFTAFLVELAP